MGGEMGGWVGYIEKILLLGGVAAVHDWYVRERGSWSQDWGGGFLGLACRPGTACGSWDWIVLGLGCPVLGLSASPRRLEHQSPGLGA